LLRRKESWLALALIVERKQAEEALRASQDSLRLIKY
jgi:hypothetical protein